MQGLVCLRVCPHACNEAALAGCYLYRVWFASVYTHADPQALEQHLSWIIGALQLAALWVQKQLGRPWQR